MKTLTITLFLTLTSIVTFSQETIGITNSLENQFNEVYRKSESYETYKVVSKKRYQNLKLNTLDSLKSSKKTISEKDSLLLIERSKIKETEILLTKAKLKLETILIKENSTFLFGMQLSKIAYSFLLWSIIIILLFGVSYFIIKFFRSNILTKKAQNNLVDVAQEFEEYRKKALEREQKLRRQLQDEINKQRKG